MTRWSYSAGERGRNRCRVFEQGRDGRLFLEWREAARRACVALPTEDRETAKGKCDELAARLRQPEPGDADRLTLAGLFDIYGRERTPLKGKSQQAADKRAAAFWQDIIGPARLVQSFTHRDAARFVAERNRRGDQRKGDAHGRPLRARVVDHEVRAMRSVLRWAVGAGLLDRNPLEGFRVEGERNPRRPVTTAPQYEKLLAKAGKVHPLAPLLLVMVHETGHRISAVRRLRWDDVSLSSKSVRWRAEFDKTRREHTTPLTTAAVKALRSGRRAAGVISEWVFPSPGDVSQPVSIHLTRDWWRRAEDLAKLPHEPGRGWHSLRRLFATELKHVPLKDLCELGGWKSAQTVLTCYQTADPVTMREALKHRGRLQALGT